MDLATLMKGGPRDEQELGNAAFLMKNSRRKKQLRTDRYQLQRVIRIAIVIIFITFYIISYRKFFKKK